MLTYHVLSANLVNRNPSGWSTTRNRGFVANNSSLGRFVRQIESKPRQSPRRTEYPLEWLRRLYTESGYASRNSVSAL